MLLGIAIALTVVCGLWVLIGVILYLFSNGYDSDYAEFVKVAAIVTVFGGALGYVIEHLHQLWS